MLKSLQEKWKVSGSRLFLIFCVFAIGGSLTGIISRKIIALLPIEKGIVWTLVYLLFLTILWPMMVLLVSLPFGQFAFFRVYLRKLERRLRPGSLHKYTAARLADKLNSPGSNPVKTKPNGIGLALFASGAGSNAQKIIAHFRLHPVVRIALVVSNKAEAGVVRIAKAENIPVLLIEKAQFNNGDGYLNELRNSGIDFIVLAGFLWKIPLALIRAYPQRIINIHPALLPAYGGKGMYGHKVHEAVIAAGEKETGITIHYVDEIYDHGQIIYQARCPVSEADTALTLAAKVQQLEHDHFPLVIESILLK